MKLRDHQREIQRLGRLHQLQINALADKLRQAERGHDEDVAALRERIKELEHAHTTAVNAYRAAQRHQKG